MRVEDEEYADKRQLESEASSDVCEIFCSDPSKISRLRTVIHEAKGLGEFFKAFADETRAAILYCLSREELCVCDVAQILGMSVQAVSHHLRLLKANGVVRYRREGKVVFYSLDDGHIANLISEGLEHVRHSH